MVEAGQERTTVVPPFSMYRKMGFIHWLRVLGSLWAESFVVAIFPSDLLSLGPSQPTNQLASIRCGIPRGAIREDGGVVGSRRRPQSSSMCCWKG